MNIRKWLCGLLGGWRWLYNLLDCKRYEPESPEPEPPEPPEPPKPKPIYVIKKVCRISGLVPTKYCLYTENKKFEKGKEPRTYCQTHVVPEFDPRAPGLRVGGSMFLWYLRAANENKEQADWDLLETLIELRKRRVHTIEVFGWICSGQGEHRHLDNKIPWLYGDDGTPDLEEFDSRYFYLLREFIRICHLVGRTEVEYCLTMRQHYIKRAIPNLLNGFYWKYFERLARHYVHMSRDVWGGSYLPQLKIANELKHRSAEQFHILGRFCERIALTLIDEHLISIDRVKLDLTASEGLQIYLNEPLRCGKCDKIHGNERFNRKDPKKSVLCEVHRVAHLKNLTEWESFGERNPLNWVGSKWQRYESSGDAGAGFPTRGYNIPGTRHYQGSASETYEMLIYFFSECKRKGKQGIYCLWVPEVYTEKKANNNNWIENWEAKNIDWTRFDAAQQAWEDVCEL